MSPENPLDRHQVCNPPGGRLDRRAGVPFVRGAAPAVLPGPVDADPAGIEQCPMPFRCTVPALGRVGVLGTVGEQGRRIGVDPGAELVAELVFLIGEVKVHALYP